MVADADWLLNVQPACLCISGTDLNRQVQVLPHPDRSSGSISLSHIEIETEDPTFHLTWSQWIDTGPTDPSADPIMSVTGVPLC